MTDAHDHSDSDCSADVPLPTTLGARVLSAPIVAYRRWVSPALPPTCRFYPSCSEYALTAIATHGPIRGLYLTIRRLLRCHPFHPGGIDHVPPRRTPRPPRTLDRDEVTGAVTR
jgi:putative membrane protein insertion efficiency factor